MEIAELLKKYGFRFDKSLGQNFITDKNMLNAIASDADINPEDTVVEIGTGAATLTVFLAERAKRVVTFEVDETLAPVISDTLKRYKNVEVVFRDVLKMSDEEFTEKIPEHFKVVANLPYYVTTPMIMRFAGSGLDVDTMTLLMQKEVADRITAACGTPEYGALTVAVESVADARVTRFADRRLFYPVPKVDSALVHIVFNRNKYNYADFKTFKKVSRCAFFMRRKTLVNNLISAFPLDKITCEKNRGKSRFSEVCAR
jgi:16S rRNA (adenine1518-N6/adenine1519-N6)-dimethyltransferase